MLTDAQCRNAVCLPDKKQARFSDSGGMYLQVSPAGSKRWFLKYRIAGAEKQLALGSYPAVTLTAARKARDAAKLQKSQGADPVIVRKVEKLKAMAPSGNTFKAVALEWHALKADGWSESHAIREKRNFENDLLPYFAVRSIGEIEAIELLAVIRLVEERGALEAAHRVFTTAGQIWRYAVATGRAKRDVTPDIRGALKPHRGKHFAAITEPVKLGGLIRAIRAYQGGPIVRTALQLAPMLFQRPGELRGMAWAELDLDAALWTVPAMRMKRTKDGKENGEPHLVPLPAQAVALLRQLQPLTGVGVLVFHGERSHDRPIS